MKHRLLAFLREHAVIAAIALVYFVVLWKTAPAVGFTRDEGYYFKAAEEYAGWFKTVFSGRFFESFRDAEITKHMSYNTEHPALVKILQAATHFLFTHLLGWASPSQGYRAAGFLFASLSLIATYWLGRSLVDKRSGILAALMVAVMPRYFYDAHLACFDVPITAMWTLSLASFYDAVKATPETRTRKAICAALIFGVALSTKLNALFLPPIFLVAWLIQKRGPAEPRFRLVQGPSGGLDFALPAIPRVFWLYLLLSPLVFYVLWPYLWNDPIKRTNAYIAFHLHHEHYPILYLGTLFVKPPFPHHFPFVMTLYTAPSPLVGLGLIGFLIATGRSLRNRSLADVVLVLATLLPLGLIATGSTPIFGGVKHWYNAMPSLAVLAARTAFLGLDLIEWRMPRQWVTRVLAGLALLPGLAGTIASHPNGIGYYNELAGGFRGGAELGMQRMFWGGLAFPMYQDLATLPPGARVFFNRTNYDSYRMYVREHRFPGHVQYANDAKGGATVGMSFEQPEHGEREAEIWSSIGTRPVEGVYQDEVTIAQMYLREASLAAPTNTSTRTLQLKSE